MPDPQHRPLEFPLKGVDVSTEFELQPPGTAAAALNVRAVEPAARRRRGGARSGLSRYVDARVGGASALVQHLNAITVASADGLLTSAVGDSGVSGDPSNRISDGVADPSTNTAAGGSTDPNDPLVRNPGRVVRPGGSGVQPNRHRPATGSGSSGWVFEQMKYGTFAFTNVARTDSVTFDNPTKKDQLLLVLYSTAGDTDGVTLFDPTVTVSDSLGNTFAQKVSKAFTSESPPYSGGNDLVYAFWVRNAAGGNCTVNVTQTPTSPPTSFVGGATLVALEYSGLLTSTPSDGESSAAGLRPGDGSMLTGTIDPGACPVGGSTRLVVLFTAAPTVHPTYTAPSGYTTRKTVGTLPMVLDKLSSASSEHPTLAFDETALPFDSWDHLSLVVGFRYH